MALRISSCRATRLGHALWGGALAGRPFTTAALLAADAAVADASPVSSSPAPRVTVTGTELYAGSRRHVGIVQLPSDIVETLEEASKGGGSAKHVRLQAAELGKALRKKSRTSVRGGLAEHPTFDPDTGLRHRPLRRSDMKTQRLRSFEGKSIEEVETEAAYRLMKPKQQRTMDEEAGGPNEAQFVPRYVDQSVAAYAANRMPSTYAAIYRILHELKMVAPDFSPTRMLDYGAGPGTAAWAVQEVWPGQQRDVLAVEPAEAMMGLGENLTHARRETAVAAGHSPPLVRWMYKLPGFQGFINSGDNLRGSRQWRNMPRFDVVVASYVLTELSGDKERRNLIKGLWELTDGMLILVEPGTPVGSANCREARTLILEQENHIEGKGAGAHVVMPCPHDGKCPLDGTKDWCHFVQRHERPRMQQQAKGTPTRKRPRGYQDEKFSYVVLRRGARARPQLDYSAVQPLTPAKEKKKKKRAAVPAGGTEQLDWTALGPDTKALLLRAAAEGEEGDDSDELRQLRRQLMAELEGNDPQERGAGEKRGGGGAGEGREGESEEYQRLRREVIAELEGMSVQEALALGDGDGDGEESEEVKQLRRELLAELGEGEGSGEAVGLGGGEEEWGSDADGGSEEEGWEGEGVPGGGVSLAGDGDAEDEELLLLDKADDGLVAAVRGDHELWARIIRTPKKRRRHVVMELCMPCHGSEAAGAREWRTISKSFDKRFKSPGPYFGARKASWGDMWPKLYGRE